MGPPTRKRKSESLSNHTLLEFFTGADTTKRAKVQQTPLYARSTEVESREIIVLDSDGHERGEGKEGVQPISRLFTPDRNIFGSETLSVTGDSLGNVFRRSLNVIQPDRSKSVSNVTAPMVDNYSVGCDLFDGTKAEFPVAEWLAGDDELAAMEVSDNAFKSDESEREHPDDQCFCPVCGTDLAGVLALEIQAHVNRCLDTTSQTDCLEPLESTSVAPSVKPGASTLIQHQRGDLFTVLMNSHKENAHWVEADIAADRDFRPTRGNRRRAPFYKVLQGMPIAVDAFCYGTIPGVTAYFLTHAHSDHYTSLGSKWKSGPIYCSEETANLIIHMLAVDPKWIHPLPLDTPTIVPGTGGVTVTLIDANHCPGSCLLFFEGSQTVDVGDSTFKSPFIGSTRIFRYLHCGDFRASPRHVLHPAVNGKHLDHIYLDTTYLDPKYTFSPQPLVISACAELARRLAVGEAGDNPDGQTNRNITIDAWMEPFASVGADPQVIQGRVLVIVGTYSIGKERIVKAIAQSLGTKIYCDSRKSAILRCQADEELHALLTEDPTEANVHMLPLGTVTSDNLKLYLQRFKGTFSRVLGFRPTGWTYSPPSGSVSHVNASIQSIISCGQSRHFTYKDLQPTQKSSYDIQIFGVPYSEHSSFFELTCFAMSCDWGRLIPTVNVSTPASRAKMAKWLKRWESEKRSTTMSSIQPRAPDYW